MRKKVDKGGKRMREKYESIATVDLRELAKIRNIQGTAFMDKEELVEAMLEKDEKDKEEKELKKSKKVVKETMDKELEEEKTKEKNTKEKNTKEKKDKEKHSKENDESKQQIEKKIGTKKIKVNKEEDKKNKSEGDDEEERAKRVDNEKASSEGTSVERAIAVNKRAMGARISGARTPNGRTEEISAKKAEAIENGVSAHGILEVLPDGYGFIRCENYLPGENDVYVSPSQIRRLNLKTGDILTGISRIKTQQEKFSALIRVTKINGFTPEEAMKRMNFEDMTPIFPNKRLPLETPNCSIAMRVMDLISPVGKGQRGMIVSPPKAGKTTLLKEVARSILYNNPKMHLIILLIDERPEEVTDIKEAIEGEYVEVIYSTFDELPEHHKRVTEMVMERAKRLVEHKKDVTILLDSITRLTRAYNLTVQSSGRTLSGGLDPAALHMPKRFFGAARNMREGGSLTILATALVDTGSKMDDVVYEEFKGTGNMEMVLDRKLSEKRIFPAIDLLKSGTRREDLLLTPEEMEAISIVRKALLSLRPEDAVDRILDLFSKTKNNQEFIEMIKKIKIV